MIFDLITVVFSILLFNIQNPIMAGIEKIKPQKENFKITGSNTLLNFKKHNLINNKSTGTEFVKSQTLMVYFIYHNLNTFNILIDEELSLSP